jgi:biopolymer transport protein TolR
MSVLLQQRRRPSQDTSNESLVPPVMSEINVVPFIDVMLVLLIIFMVSAPLMQQGIQVDLPKTKAQALNDQESQIVLVVDSRGQAMINKNIIPASQLGEKIKAIFAKREKKEIYVQADRTVAYGIVANIMATVQSAGVTRVGLVTEPVQK